MTEEKEISNLMLEILQSAKKGLEDYVVKLEHLVNLHTCQEHLVKKMCRFERLLFLIAKKLDVDVNEKVEVPPFCKGCSNYKKEKSKENPDPNLKKS